jgi:hypothetical protein
MGNPIATHIKALNRVTTHIVHTPEGGFLLNHPDQWDCTADKEFIILGLVMQDFIPATYFIPAPYWSKRCRVECFPK